MRIVPDGESRRVEMMANFRTKDTEKPDVTITSGDAVASSTNAQIVLRDISIIVAPRTKSRTNVLPQRAKRIERLTRASVQNPTKCSQIIDGRFHLHSVTLREKEV